MKFTIKGDSKLKSKSSFEPPPLHSPKIYSSSINLIGTMDPQDDSASLDEGDVIAPTEEMFVQMWEMIEEIEEEKREKELAKWLVEWKVLTDAGEAWLKGLGYTAAWVYLEAFEEIMEGEKVEEGVEIVYLPDEKDDDDEEDEDKEEEEDEDE